MFSRGQHTIKRRGFQLPYKRLEGRYVPHGDFVTDVKRRGTGESYTASGPIQVLVLKGFSNRIEVVGVRV